MFTLIGGIAGCAIGAWITLYMSYDWPLVLGGKPVGSIPPYVVIMFEMTVLFGALSTILGIAFNALFAARRLGTVAYDPRFTNDKFGIFVPSELARQGQVEGLLRGAGAEEVRRAEAACRLCRPRRPRPTRAQTVRCLLHQRLARHPAPAPERRTVCPEA